jgi:hypothetical protein
MGTLSDAQIAQTVRSNWFRLNDKSNLITAVAIALAESGGNPDAVGTNTNGSKDYGLFQINDGHKDLFNEFTWNDPNDNARMASRVYKDSGFNAWTGTYTNGKYKTFLPRATAAYKTLLVAPAVTSGGAIPGTSFVSWKYDPASHSYQYFTANGSTINYVDSPEQIQANHGAPTNKGDSGGVASGVLPPSAAANIDKYTNWSNPKNWLPALGNALTTAGVFILALVVFVIGIWMLIPGDKRPNVPIPIPV